MARAKDSDPKMVKVRLKNPFASSLDLSFDGYEFDGTPDELIAKMNWLKAEHPGKELSLSWEQRRWDDSYSLFVYEERLETAEEVAARLEQEKAIQRQRDEYDRAQYERLQKKFGKKE